MTVQNNHFNTQLSSIARPTATERPAARGTSSTATAPASGDKGGAAQTPVAPGGLVGNHVNTTA
ncbi:hypothetical protein [Burkholderia sp. Ac-20365]|jgi:hypothetical protein|uniref:hypothetical protein n=1 Tax=Burkholderia sp. Ac-20365 TaxID=2703897 RepID=UPI00197BC218|nr:hypothetical protein [Burkholderia sp. Ac-20365]MBN3764569.1 hypothetical protein [Burkholderia sp. Ac-20365]